MENKRASLDLRLPRPAFSTTCTPSPNYARLNDVAAERDRELRRVVRFGQPLKDSPTSTPIVPYAKADTARLVATPSTTSDERDRAGVPLQKSVRTPPRQPVSHSRARPEHRANEQRALRNRFDHPVTQRELEQLKFKLLQSEPDARAAIVRLLHNSQQLLEQIKERTEQGQKRSTKTAETETATVQRGRDDRDDDSEPPTPRSAEPPTAQPVVQPQTQQQRVVDDDDANDDTNAQQAIETEERRRQELRDDLKKIDDDYGDLTPDEQKALLARLRKKHGLHATANVPQVVKKIRDKLGEYEVERVVGEKVERGKKLYKVKWVGNGTTWEPEENLVGAQQKVREWDEKRSE